MLTPFLEQVLYERLVHPANDLLHLIFSFRERQPCDAQRDGMALCEIPTQLGRLKRLGPIRREPLLDRRNKNIYADVCAWRC